MQIMLPPLSQRSESLFATPASSIVCMPYVEGAACESLLEHLNSTPWSEGRIALPSDAAGVSRDIRGCRINHHIPDDLVARIAGDLLRINEEQFGFDITGFDDTDPICAMRYGVGDHFDWHIDNGVMTPPFGTRKLAFSVQLTPPGAYQGGDLEFGIYSPDYNTAAVEAQRQLTRQRGTLVVFAAFQLHRVAPVTQGIRTALVGWLHGPAFR